VSLAISRAVETILPADVLAADPVARARALVPHIAAAAPRIEATRELPPELLAMLHEARMFRTLMPRAFGGEEISPQAYVQMMIHIASADASTAWCVGQASGCSMAAAYMEPEAAQAIWGAPNAALAWGTVGRTRSPRSSMAAIASPAPGPSPAAGAMRRGLAAIAGCASVMAACA